MSKATEGEEDADDWTDGRHGQSDRESADHPLPMLREFTAPDMNVSFSERKQEDESEKRRGRGFIGSADCRLEAHYKGGNADDSAQGKKHTAGPAMEFGVVGAQPGNELQGAEDHKQCTGEDVNHRQNRMARETRIEGGRGRLVSGPKTGDQDDDPSDDCSESDQREENSCAPEQANGSSRRLHWVLTTVREFTTNVNLGRG